MIISASRRTDLPAAYPDWLFQRFREGFVLVRHPMNPHQVWRISLNPEAVGGIVFWSKNPAPMLPRLSELNAYAYYFQFTLTGYGQDMEPGIPDKQSQMIPTFRRLADSLGPERVIWRYDPILLSPRYTMAYHLDAFGRIARELAGYTHTCIISFLDDYRGAAARLQTLGLQEMDEAAMRELASGFASISRSFGLELKTCAEALDLSDCGIGHARCVDARLLSRLSGRSLAAAKDPNQRPACGCARSVDIGMYDTCPMGCQYCYANHGARVQKILAQGHDPASPLLMGRLAPGDTLKDRK